jgi:hypothetical protein
MSPSGLIPLATDESKCKWLNGFIEELAGPAVFAEDTDVAAIFTNG